MTKQKKSGGTRTVAVVLAAAMAVAMFAGMGRAESAGVCQGALEKCLAENMTMGFMGGIWGTFVGAGSCILGYDFCRKYIAPAK